MQCPKCGSENLAAGESKGEFICIDCGAVIKPRKKEPPKELSIVALVLAILALLVSWIQFGSFFGVVFSVMALVTGYLSYARIKRKQATWKNQTIAALAIAVVALVISVFVTVCSAMNYITMYNEYKAVKQAGENIASLVQGSTEQALTGGSPQGSASGGESTEVVVVDGSDGNIEAGDANGTGGVNVHMDVNDIVDSVVDGGVNVAGTVANGKKDAAGAAIDGVIDGVGNGVQAIVDDPNVQGYVNDAKKDIGNTVDDLKGMYDKSGVSPDASVEENVSGLQKLLNDFLSWLPFSSNGKTIL